MTAQELDIRPKWRWTPTLATAAVLLFITALATAGITESDRVARWILLAVLILGGVWLAIVDHRTRLLPNAIVFPLGAAIASITIILSVTTGEGSRLLSAAGGATVLGLFYLLLGLGGAVGLGDVKLAAVLGLYLGWYGWEAPLLATIATYLFAAPHALAVVVARRRHPERTRRIAFGPYLIAGAVLAAVVFFPR